MFQRKMWWETQSERCKPPFDRLRASGGGNPRAQNFQTAWAEPFEARIAGAQPPPPLTPLGLSLSKPRSPTRTPLGLSLSKPGSSPRPTPLGLSLSKPGSPAQSPVCRRSTSCFTVGTKPFE